MIQPPSFTLNNAVDNLLKNEFDFYRSAKRNIQYLLKMILISYLFHILT